MRPRLSRLCQVAIGLVFAAAALTKLGDLGRFAQDVHNFRLVPVAAENVVAMTLPWVELVAALALLLGVRARAGAVVATGLLVLFTVAVGLAIARGLDIQCGCFGTADASRVGLFKVIENVGLTAVSAFAVGRRGG